MTQMKYGFFFSGPTGVPGRLLAAQRRLHLAPEGHLRIAQRFIAGLGSRAARSCPVGTLESLVAGFSRPYGTQSIVGWIHHPAINRWAIVNRPYGTRTKTPAPFAWKRLRLFAGLMVVLLAFAGCQQQMAEQPSFKPLDACEFFPDGRSARPLVAGAVARGHLHTDIAMFTGRRDRKALEEEYRAVIQPDTAKAAPAKSSDASKPKPTAAQVDPYRQFVDTFPIPITAAVLEHGYHRYMIYCVVCHDPLGTGQGKIVERGYTAPPTYHADRLRQAPVGHFFAVMTDGFGSMPAYGPQIPPRDRWAIAAYIRALQTSQHFPERDLSAAMREAWSKQDKAAARQGGAP
jgi:mono/diheme cytochrome c family protein